MLLFQTATCIPSTLVTEDHHQPSNSIRSTRRVRSLERPPTRAFFLLFGNHLNLWLQALFIGCPVTLQFRGHAIGFQLWQRITATEVEAPPSARIVGTGALHLSQLRPPSLFNFLLAPRKVTFDVVMDDRGAGMVGSKQVAFQKAGFDDFRISDITLYELQVALPPR